DDDVDDDVDDDDVDDDVDDDDVDDDDVDDDDIFGVDDDDDDDLLDKIGNYKNPGFDSSRKNVVPDYRLRVAINKELERQNRTGWLTEEDLAELVELDADSYEIKSIEGLEFAVNLKLCDLSDNEIFDISPLEGLVNLKSWTFPTMKR
ncbi:MAG: hypothetical protein GX362_06145, partial [Methanosarcinaceae archaeon]|nr:hypothetical protein [Methanosarcinaceae archaeon]